MDEESLQIISQRCQISRDCNDRIKSLLPIGIPSTLRADFARCAIDLALEHHSGLIRLVQSGEYGTAGALLRPILEAATTAFWFVYSATCEEIRALPTVASDIVSSDIPLMGDMIKTLIPIFPPIKALSEGLKTGGTAKWLHKYTHGSAPQLTRRAGGGWIQGDVILTLIRGDMFAVLAASIETVLSSNPSLFSYAFGTRDVLALELQTKFVVTPIPPQPHGHPPAPLLADGCGPSFA